MSAIPLLSRFSPAQGSSLDLSQRNKTSGRSRRLRRQGNFVGYDALGTPGRLAA